MCLQRDAARRGAPEACRSAKKSMKLALIILFVAFATISQAGNIAHTTIDTEHLSVELPSGWGFTVIPSDTNGWTYTLFDGTNEVLTASVWLGTEFLDCFCAPLDKYRIIKHDNQVVRTIRLTDNTRTLKIAGSKYSLDIHATHINYDKRIIDRMMSSIRMKE